MPLWIGSNSLLGSRQDSSVRWIVNETVIFCNSEVCSNRNRLTFTASLSNPRLLMTFLDTMLMICSACEKPILDKYVLTVLEKPWHPNCVRCVDCGYILNEKCFSRDGKIYCKIDFYRFVVTMCSEFLLAPNTSPTITDLQDLNSIEQFYRWITMKLFPTRNFYSFYQIKTWNGFELFFYTVHEIFVHNYVF